MQNNVKSGSAAGLEENLKKAVSEMLILYTLNGQERYIGEITDYLREHNGGIFEIACPYSAIYRLLKQDYIEELKKRVAPDGRRRQYYAITPRGKEYLKDLLQCYARFSTGVQKIIGPSKKGKGKDRAGETIPE